jgi:hypothetical protein
MTSLDSDSRAALHFPGATSLTDERKSQSLRRRRPPHRVKPSDQLAEPVPDYSQGYERPARSSNMTLDDFQWIGESGSLDRSRLIEERGFEAETPVELVLMTLIFGTCEGIEESVARKRAKKAVNVLKGKNQSRRGRSELADEPILLETARLYKEAFFSPSSDQLGRRIEIAHLVELALNANPHWKVSQSKEQEKRRLAKKFKAEKDRLMMRIDNFSYSDRQEFYQRIVNLADSFRPLGIPSDTSFLSKRR